MRQKRPFLMTIKHPCNDLHSSRCRVGVAAIALVSAAALAGCTTDSGSAADAPSDRSTAPVDAVPYTVEGSDSAMPPLRLQGWVPEGTDTKDWKIGYFGLAPLNTFVQAMDYGGATAAEALGVSLEPVVANWDAIEQVNQITTALQQKSYDGIVVFNADPDAECRTIKNAAKEIPVVVVNFPVCGDTDYTEGTVGFSGSQGLALYTDFADTAMSDLSEQGGGDIAVLSGPAAFGQSKQLKQALDTTVAKYPNVNIVQNVNGDWTPEGGLQQMQTILQTNPDIDMVLSSYDQNTLGATKALKAAGKAPGDIEIYNLGGDSATFELFDQGWIKGMSYLQPMEEVGQGVEMIVAYLEGLPVPTANHLENGNSTTAGTVHITKDNIDQFQPQS
jgi:ABC-type sugar transport system substrate-binding protein